ncbi:MFS transporter [Pelosinus propionicus]|uniref:Sugar phosphate permease n=1 Tax=Pelosinus propionicus DSM 13327 TaxID=1123291 RepID=A0A1I4Q0E8_9FIRM|nr:MFS transporter [Pelosinus propionicus]SFM33551.1 Sugar phosphate permease [Pelosinus propionicus DSM 13327]
MIELEEKNSNDALAAEDKRIEQKKTKYRWVVLLIIMTTYLIQYADRSNLAIVLPYLRQEYPISNLEAGLLMSLFFLGYVITQLPSSLLYRRFGTRTIVPISVVGFSIFTYLIGTTHSAFAIKWLRLGLGLAEGPTPIGITTTINNWFPPKEKATAIGIGYVGATMIAPIIIPPLCVWIMVNYGWRSVFHWFAIPGFVVSIIWYLWVRSRPEECPYCNEAEIEYIKDTESISASNQTKLHRSLGWLGKILRVKKIRQLEKSKDVFTSKDIWLTAIGYMLILVVNNGMITWIPSYLVTEKHYSFIKMGFMSALPWIGGFLGSSVGGWLSDKVFVKLRKPTMLITSLMTAVLMAVLINIPENITVIGITLFTIGFFLQLGYPGFTAYPMGIANKATYPTAIALVNSVGNLGGFISPIVAGFLLDTFQVYSATFVFFGIAAILSFACVLLIDEPEEI